MSELHTIEIDLPVFCFLAGLEKGGEASTTTAISRLRAEFGFEWVTALRYHRQWQQIGRRLMAVLA